MKEQITKSAESVLNNATEALNSTVNETTSSVKSIFKVYLIGTTVFFVSVVALIGAVIYKLLS